MDKSGNVEKELMIELPPQKSLRIRLFWLRLSLSAAISQCL